MLEFTIGNGKSPPAYEVLSHRANSRIWTQKDPLDVWATRSNQMMIAATETPSVTATATKIAPRQGVMCRRNETRCNAKEH